MQLTLKELADLQLLGYPTTTQGWERRVKRGGWAYEERHSSGRHGKVRVYTLPKEVEELVETYRRVSNRSLAEAFTVLETKEPSEDYAVTTAPIPSDSGELQDRRVRWVEIAGALCQGILSVHGIHQLSFVESMALTKEIWLTAELSIKEGLSEEDFRDVITRRINAALARAGFSPPATE